LVYGLLLGLAFGIIAIMALFAAQSASSAASAERARIALEIHDSIGHGLTTLGVQLEAARRYQNTDSERAANYLQRAAITANELLSETRQTVAVLHGHFTQPSESFANMIGRLLKAFAATHEIAVIEQIQISREPPREVGVTLYRVLQEALTNIARHADAKEVRVSVATSAASATLRVEDKGRGFARDLAAGNGLGFMRERVQSIGGVIDIESGEGLGTVVETTVPFEQQA
jgi:signal transduction histidine kinase